MKKSIYTTPQCQSTQLYASQIICTSVTNLGGSNNFSFNGNTTDANNVW